MSPEGKIKKVQLQCKVINQLIPKANKYFILYCKAIKEAWSNGKFCGDHKDNYDILVKYNLGYCNVANYSSNKAYNFNWNPEIQELNKRYKQCLK